MVNGLLTSAAYLILLTLLYDVNTLCNNFDLKTKAEIKGKHSSNQSTEPLSSATLKQRTNGTSPQIQVSRKLHKRKKPLYT